MLANDDRETQPLMGFELTPDQKELFGLAADPATTYEQLVTAQPPQPSGS